MFQTLAKLNTLQKDKFLDYTSYTFDSHSWFLSSSCWHEQLSTALSPASKLHINIMRKVEKVNKTFNNQTRNTDLQKNDVHPINCVYMLIGRIYCRCKGRRIVFVGNLIFIMKCLASFRQFVLTITVKNVAQWLWHWSLQVISLLKDVLDTLYWISLNQSIKATKCACFNFGVVYWVTAEFSRYEAVGKVCMYLCAT